MFKLSFTDTWMTCILIVAIDCIRGLFVRFMNPCWFWDLERKFVRTCGTCLKRQITGHFTSYVSSFYFCAMIYVVIKLTFPFSQSMVSSRSLKIYCILCTTRQQHGKTTSGGRGEGGRVSNCSLMLLYFY